MTRGDGPTLLEKGRKSIFVAETERGKLWIGFIGLL